MVQRVLKFGGLVAGADVARRQHIVFRCALMSVFYVVDNQYIMKNIEKF